MCRVKLCVNAGTVPYGTYCVLTVRCTEVDKKPKSWAQVVNTGITYPGCEVSMVGTVPQTKIIDAYTLLGTGTQ